MAAPSEDFYTHVNHEWLVDPGNDIPGDYSRWGGFVKLGDEQLHRQIDIAVELANAGDKALTEDQTKVLALWKASIERFERWDKEDPKAPIDESLFEDAKQEFASLQRILVDDAATPFPERLASWHHYSHHAGLTNCVDLDTGADLTNSNNVVLDFSAPCGLSLPTRDYYMEEKFADKRALWNTHLHKVVDLVPAGLIPDKEQFVSNIVALEMELAKYKMSPSHSRQYDSYYTNTTLTDIYTGIGDLRSFEDKLKENYTDEERAHTLDDATKESIKVFFEGLYSKFNLKELCAAGMAKNFPEGGEKAPKPDQITAFDGDGIRRTLGMLLDPTRQDEILPKLVSYYQYHIIKAYQGYATKALNEEFFDFYSRTLSGQKEQKPSDKRSIMYVNAKAGELLGKIYVDKFFPADCKAEVVGMIAKVTEIMSSSIDANDWLTTPTKAKAQSKLAKFVTKIGFPDEWRDYSLFQPAVGDSLATLGKKYRAWWHVEKFEKKINSLVDRGEWQMSPQTVNAYFHPLLNEICFPAAILQPPFYHRTADTIDFPLDDAEEKALLSPEQMRYAANFGAIGAVIAHEITHGYDDQGRKFDDAGNLNDWWTAEDAALFTKKMDLMEAQAKQYSVTIDGKQYEQNAKLCMGENLADLGGLSLGLKSLLAATEDAISSDPKLKRAMLRVFFKSFANVWKENARDEHRVQRMTSDPHAPNDFRANLVANMSEFHEAFDVAEGHKMYISPEQRVRMW